MAEDLEFKISSGLKNIIGRDLITDDFIAVFELVKNSYDAFAKNVDIIINDNEIIIADNGNGMTLSDLKNKWLFVAYSEKKDGIPEDEDDKKESYRDKIQEKRHFAGAKGIGRFSSDRLGSKLSIITRKKDQNKVEEIDVDWSMFEKDQKEIFEKIKVEHKSLSSAEINFPDSKKHGTILKIKNLHRHWDRKSLQRLKHSLEKLINPFSETNNFSIKIICNNELEEDNQLDKKGKPRYIERDKVNGIVKNSILEILNLKTTQLSLEITSDEINTKIIDRGSHIYHIKEKNKEYSLLENVKIDLYFINTSAKYSFTRKMGIQVVNFGSVFLFKNGFRVQPYGDFRDDSWGLDQRKQQGYNRFLGTRDLFGRVDVISNNTKQFNEVSSRDGGLMKSEGFYQMMHAFKEKALVRLERYVVGVLWGEGFIRKKYFGDGDDASKEATLQRKKLIENDKNSEDVSTATSTLGSKLDFIQIIKSLATDKNIEIIDYNRDFVNLINENIDEHQTRFISDLEKIAEITDDEKLKSQILRTEEQYQELKKEKEIAVKKALDEEKRRIEAEKKAEEAERQKLLEEKKRKEEEERRRKAELATERKEKERALAELAKLKAQQKAKEEKEKSAKALEAQKNAEKTLEIEKDKNTYLSATRKTLSGDAEDLIHTIKLSVIGIDESLESILNSLKKDIESDKGLYTDINNIKLITERVMKLTKLITKSNFKADEEVQKADVVQFIKEYIDNYSYAYKGKIKISYSGEASFISRISLLDLSIVIDNLISNSHKAGAKEIHIKFQSDDSKLIVLFNDNGVGLDLDKFIDPSEIFNLGVKSSIEGSGIGLYSVKKKMNEMYGDITFSGNNISLKGATFKLEFN